MIWALIRSTPGRDSCSLYTDVALFFFSFFSKTTASARLFSSLSPPHPLALSVSKSPPVFVFLSRALDGLWRENRGSINTWWYGCAYALGTGQAVGLPTCANFWYVCYNRSRRTQLDTLTSDFSSYGIGSIEIIAPSRVIPARNFDEGAAQRISKQNGVGNYLHGRWINSIFCHYFQENLNQRRFWTTHVNRKWTFCTLEPWFWTNFGTNRLFKSKHT